MTQIWNWIKNLFGKKKHVPLVANMQVTITPRNATLSEAMFLGNNQFPEFEDNIPPLLKVQPEYKVWIYNVGSMTFEVKRPGTAEFKIPGKKPEEKYAIATSFPSLMKLPKYNVDLNVIDFVIQDGQRYCMDIVNPNNLGLDQDAILPYYNSIGNNLGIKGVFWSVNNPPKPAELRAAIRRMEKYYKKLLEQMAVRLMATLTPFADKYKEYIEMGCSPKNAQWRTEQDFDITPDHHAAAEHFRTITQWHPVLETLNSEGDSDDSGRRQTRTRRQGRTVRSRK